MSQPPRFRRFSWSGSFLLGCLGSACNRSPAIDDAALADEKQGADWLAFGRTYSEQRFSPLTQIDTSNVAKLKVNWYFDLPENHGLVSTPLVADGVLYFVGSLNVVRFVDAATGKLRWTYDPKVSEKAAQRLRVGWDHSRGIALWKDKVILATWDGRLIAVPAADGKEIWSTMTVDSTKAMYITGAPKVFKDKVLIGNGGTEHGPSRGYVTAYDAATGKQAWRFYIVPGNPADGFENQAMEMAAKTWTGEWWKVGGGGNAWHGFTYDAELDRPYIGTGMDIVLADLMIDGRKVKATLHAPKNGFFYVIDRETGKLISADPFTEVSRASKVDLATGRPVEVPGARYEKGSAIVSPGPLGAHPAQRWPDADWRVLDTKVHWGVAQRLDTLPIGAAMARLGETFVGTTYTPGTLEAPGPEHLVISLRELDCVTFIENMLAMTRFIRQDGVAGLADRPAAEARYGRYLQEIRYRGGHLDGYPSRLHYFSEWLSDNARRGRLRLLTRELGGVEDTEPVSFMSAHPNAYRQMANSGVPEAIRAMEQRLNAGPARWYVPEDRIASVANRIQDGDIIAATSTLRGLDVAHTGIALWKDGQLHLLHAPLVGKAVEISAVPLAQRILDIGTQDGIMVARVVR